MLAPEEPARVRVHGQHGLLGLGEGPERGSASSGHVCDASSGPGHGATRVHALSLRGAGQPDRPARAGESASQDRGRAGEGTASLHDLLRRLPRSEGGRAGLHRAQIPDAPLAPFAQGERVGGWKDLSPDHARPEPHAQLRLPDPARGSLGRDPLRPRARARRESTSRRLEGGRNPGHGGGGSGGAGHHEREAMSAETYAHAVPPQERLKAAPLSVSGAVRVFFGVMIAIGVITFAMEVSTDPTRAYAAWLHNYWVFLSLGLAGTFFSAIHYLVGATWSVVVRRIADAFASFVPVAFLLFLAVAVGIPHLYIWSSPAATQGLGAKLIAKDGYLSSLFFVARNLLYLAVWSFFSWY